EAAIPRLGVGSEPVVDLVQRGRIKLVQALAAGTPDADETGGPKRVEMLGHGLAADREPIAEGRDRRRAARAEALEQDPARRVGDGGKDGFHGGIICNLLVACQAVAAPRPRSPRSVDAI